MPMTDKMFEPLDDYEQDLSDAIEKAEDEIVPVDKERIGLLQAAAKKKLDSLETKKQISLKIRESDLSIIKQKAKEVSIPYQNIIQALLHKYASGQIKLEI